MTEQELSHEFYEQVRQEHEELRNWLGKLHQTLSQRSDTVSEVTAQVEGLIEHLNRHFQDEEDGGFFHQLVEQAPRYADRTNALREEHTQLRAQAADLAAAARSGEGSDSWWQQLDKDFHEFSRFLMRHENLENELLQDVYDEDVGSKD